MWNRHLLCLVNCCIYRHSASIDYNELKAMWCRLGNLQCISWNIPLVLLHFILLWLHCQISWICAIHLSICRSSSQLYGNVDDFSSFLLFWYLQVWWFTSAVVLSARLRMEWCWTIFRKHNDVLIFFIISPHRDDANILTPFFLEEKDQSVYHT